ncbi:MAG: metallophosphoesterase family protein [Nitrospirae bacterium]|jgi:diadenosine tetraphosphatase ApaH/serine/threonine PP2A family protein phosphatase|nr:metallophosphoesterase family protein [Nitrospirota bacterium]
MLFAVISDVHSNFDALDAVLKDIGRKKIIDIFFLGDSVGYGPDPNECVEMLSETCQILLAGNHDWGVLGLTNISYFNEYARFTIEWTRKVLTEKNKNMLESFPLKKEFNDMLFVHSTPKEPEEWHYLFTLWDAEINFRYFDNKLCFLGHSHQPFIIERVPSGELVTYRGKTRMKDGSRYIVNAGSVGQPRDGDPRACYVIVEDKDIQINRVPYDIETVQNKMRKKNLPDLLVERLSEGR